jgi:uncharacterized damage-inducible protein DinB
MAHGISRHEHSVAEAELLFLTNRHEVHHIGNGTHGTEVLDVTALLKNCLKVSRDIEVIFDRALMFAGDKNDPLDP